MLLINIEVAAGVTTRRIAQVAIRNEGPLGDLEAYSVWVDGKFVGEVVHEPEDGAIKLVSLALELVPEPERNVAESGMNCRSATFPSV